MSERPSGSIGNEGGNDESCAVGTFSYFLDFFFNRFIRSVVIFVGFCGSEIYIYLCVFSFIFFAAFPLCAMRI